MSTRAHVIITKKQDNSTNLSVHLNHHCDGYPDGVGSDLVYMLKEYMLKEASKPWDPESLQKFFSEHDSDYRIVNFGVQWDHEYFYIIDCDNKTLKCFYKGITDPHSDYDLTEAEEEEIPDNIFDGRPHGEFSLSEVEDVDPWDDDDEVDWGWEVFRRQTAQKIMANNIKLSDMEYMVDEQARKYAAQIAKRSIIAAEELIRELHKTKK